MSNFTTNNFVTQLRSKVAEASSFFRNNPLCGISLQRGAKCVAIVQMIIYGFTTLGMIFIMLYIGLGDGNMHPLNQQPIRTPDPNMEPHHGHRKDQLILLCMVVIAITTPSFILYFYLYKGIREGSFNIVSRCWNIMAAICLTELILILATFMTKKFGLGADLTETGFDILSFLCLYVVYFYKEELNRGADLGGSGDFQRIV